MVKSVPVTVSRKQEKVLEVPDIFQWQRGVPSSEWLTSFTQGEKKIIKRISLCTER